MSKFTKTTVVTVMAVVGVCCMGLLIVGTSLPIIKSTQINSNGLSCQLPPLFSLKWRHSVEHQYWQEVYHLDYPYLTLRKTYLQTFGAGTPSAGTPIPAPRGYVGKQVDLSMSEINWLVSINMQGEILLGDSLHDTPSIIPIYQLVMNQSLVNIRPVQLTLWQSLWLPKCRAFAKS